MSVPEVKMKKLIKSGEVTDKDRAWGMWQSDATG